MTNKSISQLTAGAAVSSTDLFPDVQTVGVGPVKVTAAQIGDYVLSGSGLTGVLPVSRGGTGLTSLTAGYIPYGNGTGAFSSSSGLQFDGSNLGLGVTPSAWGGAYRTALQVGSAASFAGVSGTGASDYFSLMGNAYLDSTATYKYIRSSTAVRHEASGGEFRWYNAGSGAAGNAISFTQAMTLTAAGELLLGTTSTSEISGAGLKVLNTGGTVASVSGASTGSQSNWEMYSTGASAFRFYVGWNGTINATNTTISAISDRRFKENIVDLDVGLDALLSLKPRKFDWKNGKGKDIKGDRGWIADEFQQVFPDLIDTWKDAPPEGEEPYKSVRPDLMPVVVRAIQELAAKVSALEAKQ